MADLLFYFVFKQTSKSIGDFNVSNILNPKQSNMRLAVP